MRFRLRSEIADVIRGLDGSQRLEEICEVHGASVSQSIASHGSSATKRCAVEPKAVRDAIDANGALPRPEFFLETTFPAAELFAAFERLRSTRVAIVGLWCRG